MFIADWSALIDVNFTGNVNPSSNAGAVYAEATQLAILGGLYVNNSAHLLGGALFSLTSNVSIGVIPLLTVPILDSLHSSPEFSSNVAGAGGGAIFSDAVPALQTDALQFPPHALPLYETVSPGP